MIALTLPHNLVLASTIPKYRWLPATLDHILLNCKDKDKPEKQVLEAPRCIDLHPCSAQELEIQNLDFTRGSYPQDRHWWFAEPCSLDQLRV